MTQVSGTFRARAVNTGLKVVSHSRPESEARLVQRLAKGDRTAFESIWSRHQGPVYRYAWHLSGSESVAEEATQETFLILIENPKRFDAARGALGAFLYGVARNCTLARLRQDREDPWNDALDPASESATDESLLRSETIERVREAVASLPIAYREAVVACDLEELSYEDAAKLMGCAIGTVRSRLARGRQLLAAKLKQRHEEASCGRNS